MNSKVTVTPKRNNIRWTEEETTKVVDRAAWAIFNNQMGEVEAALYAQQIVIEEASRRKSVSALTGMVYNDLKGIRTSIRQKVLELKAGKSGTSMRIATPKILKKPDASPAEQVGATQVDADVPAKTVPQTSPAAVQPLATTPAPAGISELVAKIGGQVNGLQTSLEQLAGSLAVGFGNQIRHQLKMQMNEALEEFANKASSKIRDTELLRIKVLVIGPHPSQQETIRQEMGSYMELKFIAAGDNPKKIAERSPGVDYVVYTSLVSPKFINAINNNNIVIVDGSGTTEVVNTLTNLYLSLSKQGTDQMAGAKH